MIGSMAGLMDCSRSFPKKNLNELSRVEEMFLSDSSAVERTDSGALVIGWRISESVRLCRACGRGICFSREAFDEIAEVVSFVGAVAVDALLELVTADGNSVVEDSFGNPSALSSFVGVS